MESARTLIFKQNYKGISRYFCIIALCDDGWTFHDSKCYFVGAAANRTQAEYICQSMNATLAVIRTHAQLYFMTTLNIATNAWIGLTDGAQEGNWQWNNDDTVVITDWGLSQLDGGLLENCTVMNVSDTYRWHDQSCSSINDYVCQRSKVTLNFLTIFKHLFNWGNYFHVDRIFRENLFQLYS